jgi:predicted transcriptional regulator
MTATAVRPVAIKIDEDIKARVKRLADARQRTSHWLMREAIQWFVTGLTSASSRYWQCAIRKGWDFDCGD